jgi:hypothetical protein
MPINFMQIKIRAKNISLNFFMPTEIVCQNLLCQKYIMTKNNMRN